jgi:hypothetical protein
VGLQLVVLVADETGSVRSQRAIKRAWALRGRVELGSCRPRPRIGEPHPWDLVAQPPVDLEHVGRIGQRHFGVVAKFTPK